MVYNKRAKTLPNLWTSHHQVLMQHRKEIDKL